MNELLSNTAVQAALVLVIVTGLQFLAAWLKQKFPTQVKLVDANWCYIQPIVDAAMNQAAQKNPGNPVQSILLRSVTDFVDSYRKLEGKEPTTAEINAARNEIAAAVARVTGG